MAIKLNVMKNVVVENKIEEVEKALNFEFFTLKVALFKDSLDKKEKSLKSKKTSDIEKEALKEKIKVLKENLKTAEDKVSELREDYLGFISKFPEGSISAMSALLRLECAVYEKKLFSYVLKEDVLPEDEWKEVFDLLETIHNPASKNVGNEGTLTNYNKLVKNANQTLGNKFRHVFSVLDKSDYFTVEKINVKFNKMDLFKINEAYTTGITSTSYADVNGENNTTLSDSELVTSIQKNTDKKGNVTYGTVKFRKTVAIVALDALRRAVSK